MLQVFPIETCILEAEAPSIYVRISRLILTVFYFIIVILNISTDVKNRPFLIAKHGFYELCNDYVMTIDY